MRLKDVMESGDAVVGASTTWLSHTINKIAPYCIILGFTLYSIDPSSGTKEVDARNITRNMNRQGLHLIANEGRVRFQDRLGDYYSLVDHGSYVNATEETMALGIIDQIPGVWYQNIGENIPS